MAEKQACLILYVPGLFADPKFAKWLNRMRTRGLATWHTGGKPGDMSDVFVTYDHGEGSDYGCVDTGMPKHCWEQLCRICEKEGVGYAVLHLINIEGSPSDIPGFAPNKGE